MPPPPPPCVPRVPPSRIWCRSTGEQGLWEIRFQRGVAGETSVELEYQRASKDDGGELIEPIVLEQVRQLSYFAAIRAGGRLELEAGTLPRGWQRADWAVVQSTLGQARGKRRTADGLPRGRSRRTAAGRLETPPTRRSAETPGFRGHAHHAACRRAAML